MADIYPGQGKDVGQDVSGDGNYYNVFDNMTTQHKEVCMTLHCGILFRFHVDVQFLTSVRCL